MGDIYTEVIEACENYIEYVGRTGGRYKIGGHNRKGKVKAAETLIRTAKSGSTDPTRMLSKIGEALESLDDDDHFKTYLSDKLQPIYDTYRLQIVRGGSSRAGMTGRASGGGIVAGTTYHIICKLSGKRLWESSGSVDDGYAVHVMDGEEDSSYSKFHFHKQGNGSYRITCAHGGRMFWESGDSVGGDYTVHAATGKEDSNYSKWVLRDTGEAGVYSILCAEDTSRRLWESGESVENGYKLLSASGVDNNGYAKWSITACR
jgi:hypothetical protein